MDVIPARDLQMNGDVADVGATVVIEDTNSAGELLARAALWDQAIRDRDESRAGQFLAPGFAHEQVEPVRTVMSRDVWLEMLADYVVHEWTVEEQIVDLDGDVAAVLRWVRMRTTVMGEDRSGVCVITDLWRRDGGEWRVWRRHSTPLSPGRLPSDSDS
jgi:hypothetical protein